MFSSYASVLTYIFNENGLSMRHIFLFILILFEAFSVSVVEANEELNTYRDIRKANRHGKIDDKAAFYAYKNLQNKGTKDL